MSEFLNDDHDDEDCDDDESDAGKSKEGDGETTPTTQPAPPSNQPGEKKLTQIDLDGIQQRVAAFPVPEEIPWKVRFTV